MGIPVHPAEEVAEWERERGATVLVCLFANQIGDDAFVWEVVHHPNLTPEQIEQVCEEAAKRFVDFAAHGGPGPKYDWQKRSDAGYQIWLVEHDLAL